MNGVRDTDAATLAAVGIGALPLAELSAVRAPVVDADHPRVRSAAADERSVPAAIIAGTIVDPEIPVLTLADLGILRSVAVGVNNTVTVSISPTYSGCPALAAMSADITRALTDAGYRQPTVITVLSPAWTTDEMTDRARAVLAEFGIAPPGPVSSSGPVPLALSVRCPQCGSTRTREVSRFGSTSCKAMYRCSECGEPFDHFKSL